MPVINVGNAMPEMDMYWRETEVLKVLKHLVEIAGTQKEFAKTYGISEQYLSDILNGRRGISSRVANQVGFEKVTLYKRWLAQE